MSKNTALVSLQLKAADETVSAMRANVVKACHLPNGTIVEREFTVTGTTPVTHTGLANATLTVVIPHGKVNLNFTIGLNTFSFSNVMTPMVLPGAVTSVSITPVDSDDKVTVYIFQGS